MRVSIILAHPNPASFNHVIASTAEATIKANGHEVFFHDLCAERFDPLLADTEIPKNAKLDALTEQHCSEIAAADGIVIVHPNWWGQPPAIMKGWIDRVIRPGIAYEFVEGDKGEGVPVGLLKIKTALVFNTSNTAALREREVFGDPLDAIWRNCIFGLCGVTDVRRDVFGVVVTSSCEERAGWLHEVANVVGRCFPERTKRY